MFYSPQTKGFYTAGSPLLPDGAIEISDEAYGALFEGQAKGMQIIPGENGVPELFDPTPALTEADFAAAIQAFVDETAKSKSFNDAVTLVSYKESTNTAWAAEAAAFIPWRDAVWTYAYGELAKVTAGTRSQPTVEEFLNELPVITWPD